MDRKKRILIIDDEIDLIKMLKLRLESVGYEVSYALNGISGIEAAHKERPDLIVLDILMPDIDGYEVYDELKKSSRTWSIPVIFLTAKEEPGGDIKAYKKGARFYIKKPYDPDLLLKALSRALAQGGPQEAVTKKKIIYITEEDIEGVLEFKKKLEEADFEVKRFSDIREGLNAAKIERTEFIILDGRLSSKDNHNTFFEMRFEARLKEIPVFVATEKENIENMSKELELGFITGYILRPFNYNEIFGQIRKVPNV